MYNINSPVIRRKLHLYLKKLPIRKISDLDGFTSKFYQTFKEITILHNLSQKTKELNALQLMKPVLTLIAQSDINGKENYRQFHLCIWFSLVSQLVKNPPAMWETCVRPWVGKIP